MFDGFRLRSTHPTNNQIDLLIFKRVAIPGKFFD